MAVPTAVAGAGICKGTQTRISPSDTSGSGTPSAVASTTQNLRLAYSTVGGSGVLDTCAVVTAQYN
tara:strand:+ start:26 stop:223 length:198 start_codon:yes stop_codon:yes gene_type:complete